MTNLIKLFPRKYYMINQSQPLIEVVLDCYLIKFDQLYINKMAIEKL